MVKRYFIQADVFEARPSALAAVWRAQARAVAAGPHPEHGSLAQALLGCADAIDPDGAQ